MTQAAEEPLADAPADAADWVDNRISVAMSERAIPADAVSALKEAMRGQMADRTMPAGELQKIARVLLFSIENAK